MAAASEIIEASAELATEQLIVDALAMLHDTPSRAGDEAPLARRVAEWGAAVAPSARWSVDELNPGRANVLTTFPPAGASDRCAAVLYGHLDTSLSGNPAHDYPLTGTRDPAPARLERDSSGGLRGLGLAVSKAPAACALAAYVALARACARLGASPRPFGVLLTAGGTHRAASGGFDTHLPGGLSEGLGLGVDAALRQGLATDAVINVKGGAPGVLSEEPGCMLVRLEVRDRMAPVPARGAAAGAAVRAARVAQLVEEWRNAYVHGRGSSDREVAPDAGVGAIEAGLPYKPDILPAVGNVYVYVVMLPEEEPQVVIEELEAHVQEGMAADPDWSASDLSAHVYGLQRGASTDPDSRIVRLARSAWEAEFGPGTGEVRGYTGSTDGVIFRRAGIDTVRLGVTARALPDTPAIDGVGIGEMLSMARIYLDMLARLLFEHDRAGAQAAGGSQA